MPDPLIEFKNVSLGYGRKVIVRECSFVISQGDYFGLVGPNGSGKTTILRAILGTLKPLAGEIVLSSSPLVKLAFGYVPQRESIDLVLPYTVQELVMMGRFRRIGPARRPGSIDHDVVDRSLDLTGIHELRDRIFRDLSGGQKQRTLIARALATEPTVLILDEPTNGMDLASRMGTLGLVNALRGRHSLTVIMVTHLLDDVANHAHRIALVENSSVVVGTRDEILTSERLSLLYGTAVDVFRTDTRTTILPGRTHGSV